MAKTFKGPFIVVKVNEYGIVKIKTQCAKHDQLVNQNLLVKHKQQKSEPTVGPQPKEVPDKEHEQNEPNATTTKRTYN